MSTSKTSMVNSLKMMANELLSKKDIHLYFIICGENYKKMVAKSLMEVMLYLPALLMSRMVGEARLKAFILFIYSLTLSLVLNIGTYSPSYIACSI